MSNEVGYNGWTNYETWLVALWLNDMGNVLEAIGFDVDPMDDEDSAKENLRCCIKDFVEELVEEEPAGMKADLLNAALSRVDWYGLAESFFEEVELED